MNLHKKSIIQDILSVSRIDTIYVCFSGSLFLDFRLNNVSIDYYFSFRCVQSSLTLTLPVNWFSLHLTIFLCSDILSIDFIIYFSKNNLITSIYKLSGVLHSCPQVPISIQTREKHYSDISWVVYCSKDIELLSQISNIEKNNKSGIWSKLY